MESNSYDYKKQDLLFAIVLIAVFILQFWKAHIGMGNSDEHFYTTLGYRLVQGDALFYDDWHIAQMISVFLYPLVKAYMTITGGTEGIILFMRYCYAVFTVLCGTAFYLRFRRWGLSSVLAATVYLLYTPFNIMALSYNTMSVGFLMLALMAYPETDNVLRLIISGILISCAVLNTPYLAILYLVLIVATIFKSNIISHKRWLYLTVGALISAICFLLFVFSRASVSQILGCLKYLIDPSHSTSMFVLIAKNIVRLFSFFGPFVIVFVGEVVLSFYWKNKKEKMDKLLNVALVLNTLAVCYLLFFSRYQVETGGLSVILLPFAVFGVLLRILYKHDSILNLCFDLSWFHAFLLMISSNVGPRSFVGPLILACSITVLMMFGKAVSVNQKLTIMCFSVFLISLLSVKILMVYDGSGVYDTAFIKGPLKGLRDSKDNRNAYETSLSDIKAINEMPGDSALLVTWNSWEYLSLKKKIAANSTYIYFWEAEEYLDCLEEYKRIHLSKYPAYVYLDRSNTPYDFTGEEAWFQNMTFVNDLDAGTLYQWE